MITNTNDLNAPKSMNRRAALGLGCLALAGLGVSAAVASPLDPTEDELKHILNAWDYGAIGDGTTNDTTALQTCFASAKALKKAVFLPAGQYLVTSTLVADGITIIGEGSDADRSDSPTSRFKAGTANMVVLDLRNLARISNLAVQGNNLARIGIKFGAGARISAQNIDVVRCRKASFVLAKTQNSVFINCCSRFSVRGFVLANGARNNNFIGCSSEVNVAFYNASALGTPYASTCCLEYVIDQNDADYDGPSIVTWGNDRNNWFGGIHERAPWVLRFSNLSSYASNQAKNVNFYGSELTVTEAGATDCGLVDTRNGHPDAMNFDGCCFIIGPTTPFSAGVNGRIRFTGTCSFSGANALPRRGITIPSNYAELFEATMATQARTINAYNGGSITINANGSVSVNGGRNDQGVAIYPYVDETTSVYSVLPYVKGVGSLLVRITFTIISITGSNPVLCSVPLNGSPWRRQLATYTAAGTYELLVRFGDHAQDTFGIVFLNNWNTGFTIDNISIRLA